MTKGSFLIWWSSLFIPGISIIYFFSLVLQLPFLLTVLLIIGVGILCYRWLNREFHTEDTVVTGKFKIWAFCILFICLFMLVMDSYILAPKYGAWDAWWFWNYQSKYLTDPSLWKQIYQTEYLTDKNNLTAYHVAHPDYPICMPASVAFFWRLLGTQSTIIPYCLGFAFGIFIPVIIYLDIYRRNLPVAASILFLLCTNVNYQLYATAQMADIWLAFFFTASFVSIEQFKKAKQPAYLTLAAFMLGCCAWTKNEGSMLALVFVAFYATFLFRRQYFKYFVQGIFFPLVALLVFKIGYAPSNDIANFENIGVRFNALLNGSNFEMIWSYLIKAIDSNYPYIPIGLALYAVVCIVQKRFADKNILILFVALAIHFIVYPLTPHDLEWHVSTSIDRVLLHLVPASIYVFARRCLTIGFTLNPGK